MQIKPTSFFKIKKKFTITDFQFYYVTKEWRGGELNSSRLSVSALYQPLSYPAEAFKQRLKLDYIDKLVIVFKQDI